MMNWYTKLIVVGSVIGMIVFGAFMVQQQNSNTRASMEVEGAIESALLGESRIRGKDGGMDKREMVANLVESITETQKNHGKTVKLDYMFLDVNGNVTNVDDDIDSVQFRTQILNEDGELQSSATKRISLNMTERRTGLVSGENMRVINFATTTERNASQTISIPNLKGVTKVEVDNGNVTYTVNENDITVNVKDGTGQQFPTGEGEVVKEHTKWVEREMEENYDKDGYKGTLEEYTVTGEEVEEDTIFVEEYEKEDYDELGYVGKLEEYLAYGELIEGERKFVTEQMHPNYYIDGFSGDLQEYLAWVDVVPEMKKTVENHPSENYADDEGYQGKLSFQVERDGVRYYSGEVTREKESIPVYRYQGWVEEEDVDSRVFLYRGYVTRPALDHRELAYKGWVTRPASDTRVMETKYTYEVKVYYKD